MCSAIQNQDFTVVQDYITGLKALLYMNAGGGTQRGTQRRPTAALVKDTIDLSDDYDTVASSAVADRSGNGKPKFGPYLRSRRCSEASEAAAEMVSAMQGTKPGKAVAAPEAVPETVAQEISGCAEVTPVERAVGCALKAVGAYKSLDNRAQVVALVNEVSILYKLVAERIRTGMDQIGFAGRSILRNRRNADVKSWSSVYISIKKAIFLVKTNLCKCGQRGPFSSYVLL